MERYSMGIVLCLSERGRFGKTKRFLLKEKAIRKRIAFWGEEVMNGKLMLYLDQFGNYFYARTVKELREKVGTRGSRISKMYVDGADGARHVGYVIAGHWLSMFTPVELPVK